MPFARPVQITRNEITTMSLENNIIVVLSCADTATRVSDGHRRVLLQRINYVHRTHS